MSSELPSDAELAAMVTEARAAWPDIDVPATEFVAYLAGRRSPGGAAFPGPRAADLFIACACARGDVAAIAAFQQRYAGEIERAGARARSGPAIVEEVRQNIARVLFTGDHPAIAGYAGRGDLRGWIRVIAMREVLRLLERSRRELPLGDHELLDVMSPGDDPELAFLKDRYRDQFKDAFRDAVAALTDRERALFRHQLVDGWGIDELSAHHGVSRSTAARWLAAARRHLLDDTRERLKLRWGATTLEVDSVIRLLTSRLDVSLERALRG